MRITWSVPVPGESLASGRGDLVRARKLMEGLAGDGHEVRVALASEGTGVSAGVRAYRKGFKNQLPERVVHALRRMARLALARSHGKRTAGLAREHGSDVIVETQVHGIPSGALAARLAGLPLVLDDCSPHREAVALLDGSPRSARRRFLRQVGAAEVASVSSRALAIHLRAEGIGQEKLRVVPNGVEVPSVQAGARARVRREMGLGRMPVLAFAGSFQPWHRIDLLVEAVGDLLACARIHLVLIGDGTERESVFRQVSRSGILDRVTFTGMVPPNDVSRILAAADIGVLPGTNDYGQPMKLLEYGAVCLPAVAPDLPPVREVLQHERSGLLFPPGDARGLRNAILALIQDPSLRERLGEGGRQAVGQRSWSNSARALADVLDPWFSRGGSS